MRKCWYGSIIGIGMFVWTVAQAHLQSADSQAGPSTTSATSLSPRAFLERYCLTCHNEKQKSAGRVPVAFDQMDVGDVRQNTEVWEKIVRKLRAGVMPPVGLPRPEKRTYDEFVSHLENEIDRAAMNSPNPGRTDSLRRMNRTEYRNAIRDLLKLEVDVTALLPADDSSDGFDNINLGGFDPGRLERYLAAAQKISRLALGGRMRSSVADTVSLPSDLPQDEHVDGLPFGTRGGIIFPYNFPLDAQYEISVELSKGFLLSAVAGLVEPHQVVFTLDGERVSVLTVEPPAPRQPRGSDGGQDAAIEQPPDAGLKIRVPVRAGPRMVGVTFVNKGSRLFEGQRKPFLRPHITLGLDTRTQPAVHSVTITGPFEATGAGDTPSRRHILACQPKRPSDEVACAKTIISTLARRAYRRPVNATDLRALMALYHEERSEGSFDDGIERALQGILSNPAFLFRIEREPVNIAGNTPYRISDTELASRLSFFLWSSVPDDELLDMAKAGKLKDPAVLEQQVRRMLADNRSAALVNNFGSQWLLLRNLHAVTPDVTVFPDFDESLRRDFRRETELFLESIIREDRRVTDLLRANYTFVNERLARHYGIPNVYGSHFRRVMLGPDSLRGGLLGQGSILTVTSYATRTSPVIRGKWVMENILGTPPPPPPANVPPLSETNAKQALSMRERMVQHRVNPVCANCHAIMDPIGLSLENFDAVGRWRTRTDGFAELDASGALPDGSKFDGVAGLKKALLSRHELFVSTLTEKLFTYGLGRPLEYHDAPAVRTITHEAAQNNYRFSSLILGIVKSIPFQMRRSAS